MSLDSNTVDGDRLRKATAAALDMWGFGAQMGMVQEEAAELIQAVSQFGRERVSVRQLVEEVADVEIMLDLVRAFFGDDCVDDAKNRKLLRLEERIRKSDKGGRVPVKVKVWLVYRITEDGVFHDQGIFSSREKAIAAIKERGDRQYAVINAPFTVDEMLPHEQIECRAYWPLWGVYTTSGEQQPNVAPDPDREDG
jgi:NTP pyrophosphatase (non-canonical NTP hydrolase)